MFWPFKKSIPDPEKASQKWLRQTAQESWKWVAIDINNEHFGQRSYEIHLPSGRYFSSHQTHPESRLILGRDQKISFNHNAKREFNNHLADTIQDGLTSWFVKEAQEILKTPFDPEKNYNLEQEHRAQLWLEASFKVIAQGLEKCKNINSNNSEISVFQGQLFAGDHKNYPNAFHWRFILFNIDFQLWFHQENGALEVRVFKFKESKSPELHAVFHQRKRAVFEQFIEILNAISLSIREQNKLSL